MMLSIRGLYQILAYMYEISGLKPKHISSLFSEKRFLCSTIFELQKNHPKEPLGILSRRTILLAIYNDIWNEEQISVLLPLCSKQWLFHYSC